MTALEDSVEFEGQITSTTPEGREAIVTLDVPVQGMTYAVISFNTIGRVAVMNGKGRLKANTRVRGCAVRGVDALRAVSVKELDTAE